MRYPETTIWYVEAENGLTYNSGSAVCVWLKSRIDSADPGKRYLLTAAHVIRQNSAGDGKPGYGPHHPTIRVWEPGKGYAPDAALEAQVSNCLHFPNGEIEPQHRGAFAEDWVLLEVEEPRFATAAEPVRAWSNPCPQNLRLYGYPGGRASVTTHYLVQPKDSREFRLDNESNGIICTRGPEDAGRGMSGGGLFNQEGELIGIHRSIDNQVNVFRSVSIAHIRNQLNAVNLEFVMLDTAEEEDVYDRTQFSNKYFLNRNGLRPKLKSLGQSDSNLGVIIVRGDSGSGKSWTKHIFEAAARINGAEYIYFYHRNAVSLDKVLQWLYGLFGESKASIPDPEDGDTRSDAYLEHICLDLMSICIRKEKQLWIAVDDLGVDEDGVPVLDELVRHFFDQFAMQMLNEPFRNRFRLLLLDYPGRPGDESEVPVKWESDCWVEDVTKTNDVSENDLNSFLKTWSREQQLNIHADYRTELAQWVLAESANVTSSQRLRELNRVLTVELDKLLGGEQ